MYVYYLLRELTSHSFSRDMNYFENNKLSFVDQNESIFHIKPAYVNKLKKDDNAR